MRKLTLEPFLDYTMKPCGQRGEADPEDGSIRLAAMTTAGEMVIPALLASFTAKHPGVDCKLEVATRTAIWPTLSRHESDVVVAG